MGSPVQQQAAARASGEALEKGGRGLRRSFSRASQPSALLSCSSIRQTSISAAPTLAARWKRPRSQNLRSCPSRDKRAEWQWISLGRLPHDAEALRVLRVRGKWHQVGRKVRGERLHHSRLVSLGGIADEPAAPGLHVALVVGGAPRQPRRRAGRARTPPPFRPSARPKPTEGEADSGLKCGGWMARRTVSRAGESAPRHR